MQIGLTLTVGYNALACILNVLQNFPNLRVRFAGAGDLFVVQNSLLIYLINTCELIMKLPRFFPFAPNCQLIKLFNRKNNKKMPLIERYCEMLPGDGAFVN